MIKKFADAVQGALASGDNLLNNAFLGDNGYCFGHELPSGVSEHLENRALDYQKDIQTLKECIFELLSQRKQ